MIGEENSHDEQVVRTGVRRRGVVVLVLVSAVAALAVAVTHVPQPPAFDKAACSSAHTELGIYEPPEQGAASAETAVEASEPGVVGQLRSTRGELTRRRVDRPGGAEFRYTDSSGVTVASIGVAHLESGGWSVSNTMACA